MNGNIAIVGGAHGRRKSTEQYSRYERQVSIAGEKRVTGHVHGIEARLRGANRAVKSSRRRATGGKTEHRKVREGVDARIRRSEGCRVLNVSCDGVVGKDRLLATLGPLAQPIVWPVARLTGREHRLECQIHAGTN